MSEIDKEAALRGTTAVLEATGIKGVSAGELEVISEAVVGLVQVMGQSALKRAAAAGAAAAGKISNADEAEQAAEKRQ